MLRGAKRRGNPYLFRQKPAKSAEFVRFRNGLPRQCVPQGHLLRGAHWLAMTGFFDSLMPACVMRAFLQPISARIYFGKTASHLLRRMFSYARRPNGRSFLCAGRRGDVASPPTGDLPHPSVGRGPRAPPGSMLRGGTHGSRPTNHTAPPFGAEHHRQADVGVDDPVRPNSAKRCHSEPVTVSLAWESVSAPLGLNRLSPSSAYSQ